MELIVSMDVSKRATGRKERMNEENNTHTSPNNVDEELLYFLKKSGFNFGVMLPCSVTKGLYKMLEIDNEIKVFNLTREEEGVGISTGAYLSGKKPFMLIQSSGLGNSFNAIASLLKAYKIPLLILASFRGYFSERILAQIPLGKTLPNTLKALEIPYLILEDNLTLLEPFCEEMFRRGEPFVVLLSPELYENE